MSIINTFGKVAAEVAAREQLKKGKTEEQKKAIDFLYNPDDNGCLGCLNKLKSLNMSEYMAIVQRKCQSLDMRSRALQKIGLDPSQVQEIPPIVLSSFKFSDVNLDLVRIENNIAVSPQYSITWIFFSSTQMYTYQYIFDTTSDDTWEYTNDFFYTDITCFSTTHKLVEKIDIKPGKGCMPKETITKSHYVVDQLEITVPGTNYWISLRDSETISQSIMAAKAMIREKKYAL